MTAFARTGNPSTATGAPPWPRFNAQYNPEEISLQPASDTEVVTAAEVSAQHNCAFWDRIAPKPVNNPTGNAGASKPRAGSPVPHQAAVASVRHEFDAPSARAAIR